jgi:hypothetical protein
VGSSNGSESPGCIDSLEVSRAVDSWTRPSTGRGSVADGGAGALPRGSRVVHDPAARWISGRAPLKSHEFHPNGAKQVGFDEIVFVTVHGSDRTWLSVIG